MDILVPADSAFGLARAGDPRRTVVGGRAWPVRGCRGTRRGAHSAQRLICIKPLLAARATLPAIHEEYTRPQDVINEPSRSRSTVTPSVRAVRAHVGGLGRGGHAGRRDHRRATGLARPQLRHPVAELRPPAPAAHQRGDLRLRRLRAVGHLVLRGAAHLPGAACSRRRWPPSCSGAGRR